MTENKNAQETVKCARCEKTTIKNTACEKDGRHYCCPECLEGKTCDCQ